MTATLEQANAAIRDAVIERLDSTPEDDPKMAGYLGPSSRQRLKGDGILQCTDTPAVSTLRQAIDAVTDRHGRYGPPTEHFARTAALVNAAFGTSFTPADWALVMVLDKVARQRGSTGGHDDAAIDIAGYAACHQECRTRG